MKLDLLVIAAHPDDAEVAVGGTLIKHIKEGRKAGVIDLTCGELGTRGNAEIRLNESEEANFMILKAWSLKHPFPALIISAR